MSQPDPVVERVARAIQEARSQIPWNECYEDTRNYYRDMARAAVAAMGDTTPESDSDEAEALCGRPVSYCRHGFPRPCVYLAGHVGDCYGDDCNHRAAARSVPVPVAPQTQHGDEAAARDVAVAALYGWAEDCSDDNQPVHDLLVDGMCEAIVAIVSPYLAAARSGGTR